MQFITITKSLYLLNCYHLSIIHIIFHRSIFSLIVFYYYFFFFNFWFGCVFGNDEFSGVTSAGYGPPPSHIRPSILRRPRPAKAPMNNRRRTVSRSRRTPSVATSTSNPKMRNVAAGIAESTLIRVVMAGSTATGVGLTSPVHQLHWIETTRIRPVSSLCYFLALILHLRSWMARNGRNLVSKCCNLITSEIRTVFSTPSESGASQNMKMTLQSSLELTWGKRKMVPVEVSG